MPQPYIDDLEIGPRGGGGGGPQLPAPPPDVPLPAPPNNVPTLPGGDVTDRLLGTSRPGSPADDAALPPPPPPTRRLSNVPMAEPGPLELPGGVTGRSSGFFESLPARGLGGAPPVGAGGPLAASPLDDPRRRLPDDDELGRMILGS